VTGCWRRSPRVFVNVTKTPTARQEFLLHYQPKISLATGRIVGFEALLRWKDLQEAPVTPGGAGRARLGNRR